MLKFFFCRPTYRTCLLLCIFTVLCLSGCGNLRQIRPDTDYYALEYDSPRFESRPPASVSIGILPFSATAFYQTRRIAYRDTPYKRDAYYYHHWEAPPAEMVTQFLSRDLSNSGRFQNILDQTSGYSTDFTLKGSVAEFLQWEIGDKWSAVVDITITVYSNTSSHPKTLKPYQKSYRITEPCNQNNPVSLAEAMSRAMASISRQVVNDVYGYVVKIY